MAQVEACRAAETFRAVAVRSADCLVAILRLESMAANGEAAGKRMGFGFGGLRRGGWWHDGFVKLEKSA